MDTVLELETRRDAVLAELKTIRSMRRGTVNEQYLSVRHKGVREPAQRGPYFVLSRYDAEKRKTVSRRLTTPGEVERARRDIAAHERFIALCQEFARLTERLGEAEGGGATEMEVEKKRRRSSSRDKKK